jgi:hypothetical protein
MVQIIELGLLGIDPRDADYLPKAFSAYQSAAEDGDPGAVWSALETATAHQVRPPDWIMDQMAATAPKVRNAMSAPDRNEAEAVGRALGFGAPGKGQSSSIDASHRTRRARMIAFGLVFQERVDAEAGKRLYFEAAMAEARDRWSVGRGKAAKVLAEHREWAGALLDAIEEIAKSRETAI